MGGGVGLICLVAAMVQTVSTILRCYLLSSLWKPESIVAGNHGDGWPMALGAPCAFQFLRN